MKDKIIHMAVLVVLVVMTLMVSCKKEFTPYETPFFHINVDNKATVEVLANRKDVVDYKVYLSAELQFEPITVQYEVIVGNGLLAGRDFELITTGTTLNFAPGIFERPITIAWREATLDPAKDNTIRIRLLSNSKNFTMGLPGPDQLQKELIITRK